MAPTPTPELGGVVSFHTRGYLWHDFFTSSVGTNFLVFGMTDDGPPRRASGEHHPRAKLTDAQVRQMRDDYELNRMTMRAIAAKFEVSWHTTRHLLRYERRPFTRPPELLGDA